ncbi:MAG: methyltransferase [Elusimicrobia bacterium]|nr:methyltransferase [Elusimicrobiota bacterium]
MDAESILGLARNFMECRILLTGAELDVFTRLAAAPLSSARLARKIGADERALTAVLDALSAMGLLVKKAGRYRCPPAVAALLSKSSPRSVLPMVLHTTHLWERWSGLTAVVRGAKKPAGATAHAPPQGQLSAFIGAMHVIASKLAPQIVAAIKPGSAEALLDIGGGSGSYTLAFLKAAPRMKATLFDRPPVIGMARKLLGEAGVLDRVTLAAGDFYRDELPPGHDLALLSAVIHQNSSKQNRELFAKAFRALKPGGRIVIRDHVMSADRTRPKSGAIFAINMLVGTAGGGAYTAQEIGADLRRAGFTKVRLLRQGRRMDALIEAFRPRPSRRPRPGARRLER